LVYTTRRYFVRENVYPHIKILVSFVIVVSTIDAHQFGVHWPQAQQKLGMITKMLSLDVQVLGAVTCSWDINFYTYLLVTTLPVVVGWILYQICLCLFWHSDMGRRMYSDKFALAKELWYEFISHAWIVVHPVVTRHLVSFFGCNGVQYHDGRKYFLYVDQRIECYTVEWYRYRGYVIFGLVCYSVMYFVLIAMAISTNYSMMVSDGPIKRKEVAKWMTRQKGALLRCLRRELPAHAIEVECPCVKKYTLEYKRASFVTYGWELLEIIRKASLTTVGFWWSTHQTAGAVATALVISVVALVLHALYYPWKNKSCNRLQLVCLSVTTLIYFMGILIQTQNLTGPDKEGIGVLACVCASTISALALYIVVMEYQSLRKWEASLSKLAHEDRQGPSIEKSLQEFVIDPEDIVLGSILGRGAEGAVHSGEWKGAEVAVKVTTVTAGWLTEGTLEELIADAQSEAKMLAPLRHPNVIVFFGVAVKSTSTAIDIMTVLERCQSSAEAWVLHTDVDISMRQKIGFIHGVAKGMAYLHARMVIHRDLKLANILLNDAFHPKIGDFGLSKKETTMDVAEKTGNVGTPVYMDPHMITEELTAVYTGLKADIYSFGIIIWAVYSRAKPYAKLVKLRRLNMWTLMDAITNDGMRPNAGEDDEAVQVQMPYGVQKLMQRCWHDDPDRRPDAFEEIVDYLGDELKEGSFGGKEELTPTANPMVAALGEGERSAALL
jgi:tRNA A-37 threonylcarbamoyl transferase component Bud32